MRQNENPQVVNRVTISTGSVLTCVLVLLVNNLVRLYLLSTRLTGYLHEVFLRQVLPELLDDVPLCILRWMWFQQDGAPAHTSMNVRQYIDHRTLWVSAIASQVSRFNTFELLPPGPHEEFNLGDHIGVRDRSCWKESGCCRTHCG